MIKLGTDRLRVLIVVEPGLNGVFRHAEGLCDYLLEQTGVSVGLAYSDVRGSDALGLFVQRVQAKGGPVLNLRVDNGPSAADLSAGSRLALLVNRFRPHVIHSHSSKAGGLSRGLWWANVNAAQFYTPNAYFGLNRSGGLKTLLFNGAESVLGRVGQTINVSHSERRFARERLNLSSGSLLSIPNAVDCGRFYPATLRERGQQRARLGLPDTAWVFGTVGRYSDQKDPHTLYRAVERVLTRSPDAWFAHLGEGEAFEEMGDFLRNRPWASRVVRVRYDSEPAGFYRTLDAFVLSSRYEGLPISGIEALATGLPLVFTRCPGCEDFAFMGLNGVRWARIGEPETLSAALHDVRALTPSAVNHREIAEQTFSRDAVYGAILAAYRAAASERAGIVR
jgi:glycosyltransferase involved in cell wall biosynthesis